MKSGISPHTVTFGRNKTSISLEDAFWIGLRKIARRKQTTASKLVLQIARKKHRGNLSSAVRVFVLDQLHVQASAENLSESENCGCSTATLRG
jgi:predicted DNA-binding ribbon-helix-helix protein